MGQHESVPVAFFIFSLDSGDVDVEPDMDTASAAIEPQDVSIAEVVDDCGQRYTPTTDGRVTVLVATGEVDRGALEARLRSSHEVAHLQINDQDDFVLGFADAAARWEWEHRWPRWPMWLDRRLHGTERRRYV
ncbi:MAG: hypothetical protein WKF86_01070 [Acidimicrobiales bacterium]